MQSGDGCHLASRAHRRGLQNHAPLHAALSSTYTSPFLSDADVAHLMLSLPAAAVLQALRLAAPGGQSNTCATGDSVLSLYRAPAPLRARAGLLPL